MKQERGLKTALRKIQQLYFKAFCYSYGYGNWKIYDDYVTKFEKRFPGHQCDFKDAVAKAEAQIRRQHKADANFYKK